MAKTPTKAPPFGKSGKPGKAPMPMKSGKQFGLKKTGARGKSAKAC